MKCPVCGIPTATETEWYKLSDEERKSHIKNRTLARRIGGGLCPRDYKRPEKPVTRRTNAETYALFLEHDPGPDFTLAARFRAVSKATGIKFLALRSAARAGEWEIDRPEVVDWETFTHRGVTYWIKPGETRADAIRRVRHRLQISPLQRKTA